MYISKIEIQDFRNFQSTENGDGTKSGCTIEFQDGINIVIGHNNSGKSNLLKALDLVVNYGGSKKLDIDDFNKNTTIANLLEEPPKVIVKVTFTESDNEDEFSDDLVTASTWLTKLDSPYSAQLTYVHYLPQREHEDYKKELGLVNSEDIEDYWLTIKHQFLKKYTSKIYCGNPDYKNVVDNDTIKKVDFQFLDAIRDVERDLFSGKNTLLREVIDFFIDYEIKSDTALDKNTQRQQISVKRKAFSKDAKNLIAQLQKRMELGKKEMLEYATETGASFQNAEPDFSGHILDTEMYSALKLIVKHETGITIPATHNGLGYNNLIFISLLLAKMQKDASGDYLGSNAKSFPILAIEEPEAHLHPAMQYKFLKFLKENNKNKTKQVFITSHSPSITSAVELDNIICLHRLDNGQLNIAYLGRVFGDDEQDSKAYVQRFLDATKSDMLFSKSVVFVEGITEQLLLPVFAEYNGESLESEHVSVINIGGRYFNHFLKLFDSTKPYTINKKVACITDLDPTYSVDEDIVNEKCYPFENNDELVAFNECSNKIVDDYSEGKHPNIQCFSQDKGVGKTFEYAIAYENPKLDIHVVSAIANNEEIKNLIKAYNEGKNLNEMIEIHSTRGNENKRIIDSIQKSGIDDEELKKHLISARYLNSLSKGENAYDLAHILEENLPENECAFQVPSYISNAIQWLCR
ncbi:AAA family ATPase [Cellulophaga sp. F20128]|uniref:ATP-dependent nuclease n=1 Tax=Cellulophaga sp. F20128 TaxID=2926413 RepID=UPI001FF523E2|nr:AAA family ATPase [Cellulophaga sp. F20128]MCK0158927.1 AAA family ATPase [Cellulophaga sp. F20128]